MSTTYTRLPTPIGELLLTASASALTGVYFPPFEARADWSQDDNEPVLVRTRRQLTEYFAGTRTSFDLRLEAAGSAFERRVWDALRKIPYGATTSYSELARRLGDVKATRAVGAANGKNPIPIIVPCHRVVGARGELTGFGGGLDRKRWLLEHEGALMKLG
ncbi:MAG TPA: methylated-DNA--[protein]-cysteine S-methyltransferase [Gemmatimonadales bacterium]|jgi:methylated-DNA-[protein]-cysteine S-methyltransferase|nr:methylated-DNA--[protein]-cysteine S-methyltransferase [Gemmatimonadales bacterium]